MTFYHQAKNYLNTHFTLTTYIDLVPEVWTHGHRRIDQNLNIEIKLKYRRFYLIALSLSTYVCQW